MQLGELQHQIERFRRRKMEVIALSVDPADDSLGMIDRLGLSFKVGSDPNQRIIQQFRVQNPDTKELALHAVYLLSQQGKVIYRKVGSRRPRSAELIDAIDAYRGVYPQTDSGAPRKTPLNVAYPQNNFQALLEISAIQAQPASINQAAYDDVVRLIKARQSDDAVFAFRRFLAASHAVDEQSLYDTAAWMTRSIMFANQPDAMNAGEQLRTRLARVRSLSRQTEAATDAAKKETLQQQLARARAGLSVTRAHINKNAANWNLRFAKTMLRSYRELVRAASSAKTSKS